MKNFKPETYNSLSPYFIVEDTAKWIEFLKSLFKVEELRCHKRADGSVLHGELRLDDSVIMYSQATEEFQSNQFLMHMYVQDARVTYKKALSLGCEGLQEPIQKDDSDLRGMFRDFAGNVWAVGTQVDQ